jgi:histidinol-phosphate aminotransferase
MCNGSDEILNFAFMAFGDKERGFAFPALTYGFYSVFAELYNIPYREIPLREDFTIRAEDYHNLGMNIVIANPNAPTGIALTLEEIEGILKTNRDYVVVIDEAYVDFGGTTCMPLIEKYDNLLVTRTFSKSYSLAGARLGFGAGSAALIADLNAIKFSTNPYNVNRMTMAAGKAALESNDYYMANCKKIMAAREETTRNLRELGFRVLPSTTNFILAGHPTVPGKTVYQGLRERGILVRHFGREDIKDYVRITIGTKEQMDTLVEQTALLLKEVQKNG